VSVAELYSGTRITWKRRWPWVAVAAASVYVLRRPLLAPVPWIDSVKGPAPVATALVAFTYSYLPELLRAVEPLAVPPATPSPYESVLEESMAASCIWMTRSRSPTAIGVAAPRLAPSVIVVAAVPAATVAVPGQ
jgi:hypothetical protein